jgi:hypothetical protein
VSELPSPMRTPWSLQRDRGLRAPIVVTMQGLLQDDGAGNSTGFSVTNALQMRIQ